MRFHVLRSDVEYQLRASGSSFAPIWSTKKLKPISSRTLTDFARAACVALRTRIVRFALESSPPKNI